MEPPSQNSHNYCIILAGGIGSRLWPYSRVSKPKQFLDFFYSGFTMLQRTFNRMVKVVDKDNIYISTYSGYLELVCEQLPEIPRDHIVCEPIQLGTAPAVGLVATIIAARDPKANITICPSDQLIVDDNKFRQQLNDGYAFVEATNHFLTLGIKALRAETNFGYIQADEAEVNGFPKVKSFTEKPALHFAKLFVQSGEFYWNTGLFQCSVATLLNALRVHYSDIDKLAELLRRHTGQASIEEFVNSHYPRARYRSVDLVILEDNTNVCINPGSFGWYDPGDWDRLYNVLQKDDNKNVVLTARATLYNCKNNLLISDSDIIVLLYDLEDCIIVQHGNILMACKRGDPTKIRRMMQDAEMRYGKETL